MSSIYSILKPDEDDLTNYIIRGIVALSITIGLTILNYKGIELVGKLAMTTCLISLIPFAIFCIVGATKVDPRRWLNVPAGGLAGVNWRLLLNTFFWNINYWESAACFADEVEDPEKNYPKVRLSNEMIEQLSCHVIFCYF